MTKESYLEAVLQGVQQYYDAAQGSAGARMNGPAVRRHLGAWT